MNLNDVLKKFVIGTQVTGYGDGHINDTYLSSTHEYILQKINTDVFVDPTELMENIVNVTEFLKKKIREEGGDEERETLTVIKTIDGKNFYVTPEGEAYRVYRFIHKSKSISVVTDPMELYQAAKGFGKFTKMLEDFPAETLHETIPDFHNTPKRLEAFKAAVEADVMGRAKDVKKEIEFVLSKEGIVSVITDGIKKGELPLRVTHNDTKINNVLFDEVTGKPVCVIDLDTVMPGSLLYDYGDALRIGASTAPEDETDLSNVWFDVTAFKLFTKGYFEEMGDCLTDAEIELLPFSAKLITLECGMRFLTDYLNGDKYFKIHRPNHNLDRARTQFKLVEDIENKEQELKWIIKDLIK